MIATIASISFADALKGRTSAGSQIRSALATQNLCQMRRSPQVTRLWMPRYKLSDWEYFEPVAPAHVRSWGKDRPLSVEHASFNFNPVIARSAGEFSPLARRRCAFEDQLDDGMDNPLLMRWEAG